MMQSASFSMLRRVLSEHPSLLRKNRLLIHPPLSHSLRALYFEPSATASGESYVWQFLMPLCIPQESLTFDLGIRLGGGTRTWNNRDLADSDELCALVTEEVMPHFAGLQDPLSVQQALDLLTRETSNAFYFEAHGYIAARYGVPEVAIRSLNRVLELVPQKQTWEIEMRSRARRLLRMLHEDLDGARGLLDGWRKLTLENLGLAQLASPPDA